MTNGERIRNMSNSELAVFLEELDAATWDGAFYEEVCGLCARNAVESVPCSGEDCPYGNSCEWWLSQPVRECEDRYQSEHNKHSILTAKCGLSGGCPLKPPILVI